MTTSPKLSLRKRLLFCGLTGVLLGGLLEGTSFVGCRYLQKSGVIYRPYQNPTYPQYRQMRDKTLGWPAPATFGQDGQRDVTGSRIVPSWPDPEQHGACISLYGDSFTWGTGVEHAHVWGNVLAENLGARVANYGVSGYGTDQALLRFLDNTADEAPVTFLNHLSENILRNVNQYRQLLYPGDGLGFKPRFLVDERGRLAWVPLPDLSVAEYRLAVRDPGSYLAHEYFVPDGPGGTHTLSFPYAWTLLKSGTSCRVRAALRGAPWYTPFYDVAHPSNALAVTVAICQEFCQQARGRGKTPILTVIPTGRDLRFFQRTGRWPCQPLIDELSRRRIQVLNFGIGIVQHLGANDPRTLFLAHRIGAHYNDTGHRLLARIASEHLKERGLLSVGENEPQPCVSTQNPEEVSDDH